MDSDDEDPFEFNPKSNFDQRQEQMQMESTRLTSRSPDRNTARLPALC